MPSSMYIVTVNYMTESRNELQFRAVSVTALVVNEHGVFPYYFFLRSVFRVFITHISLEIGETNLAVLKLSNPCISDQCIHLLNQTNTQYEIHINTKDIALTCFSKNIPSSGSTVCRGYNQLQMLKLYLQSFITCSMICS